MFTGIVQTVGQVRALQPKAGDVELLITAPALGLESVALGDSISVNGCCLTVTRIEGGAFAADASSETLNVTTMHEWRVGRRVNLEKALCAGQPLGGHYVTGHVDGIAQLLETRPDARSIRMVFEVPPELARYIARKGSVCLDGVSLTVNDVDEVRFGVNIIPHTLSVTTLGDVQPGARLNVEVDIIARYLERLGLGARDAGPGLQI